MPWIPMDNASWKIAKNSGSEPEQGRIEDSQKPLCYVPWYYQIEKEMTEM